MKKIRASGWTQERRAQQAERIRHWRPWEQSTGPKTADGKAIASRNAYKGGTRFMLRELGRTLRDQAKALDELQKREPMLLSNFGSQS